MHLSELYIKAVDIFKISQHICAYLNYDLRMLKVDGREDQHIYFSGDIVRQSVCLSSKVLTVRSESNFEKRYKHIKSLVLLTNRINRNLHRLEKINTNGKDFFPILKRELKKFRTLQRSCFLDL